jgi:hypothetical protein
VIYQGRSNFFEKKESKNLRTTKKCSIFVLSKEKDLILTEKEKDLI